MPRAASPVKEAIGKEKESRRPAQGTMREAIRRSRFPDLTGLTIGTWRILYESKEEERTFCMCRCLVCGVKKIIATGKFLKGYVLKCPECRIRRELAE